MKARLRQLLRRHLRMLVLLALVGVALVALRTTDVGELFSPEHLRNRLAEHRSGGLLLFVALFALGNLMHVPGLVFMAAAVLVLGPLAGGLVTYLAAVTSCLVTFAVVRCVGGDAIQRLEHPWAVRIVRGLHRRPIRNMVLLRTVLQTLPALNYSLALSGVGFARYLVGTLIGLPLPITVHASTVGWAAGWIMA